MVLEKRSAMVDVKDEIGSRNQKESLYVDSDTYRKYTLSSEELLTVSMAYEFALSRSTEDCCFWLQSACDGFKARDFFKKTSSKEKKAADDAQITRTLVAYYLKEDKVCCSVGEMEMLAGIFPNDHHYFASSVLGKTLFDVFLVKPLVKIDVPDVKRFIAHSDYVGRSFFQRSQEIRLSLTEIRGTSEFDKSLEARAFFPGMGDQFASSFLLHGFTDVRIRLMDPQYIHSLLESCLDKKGVVYHAVRLSSAEDNTIDAFWGVGRARGVQYPHMAREYVDSLAKSQSFPF